MPRGFHVEKIPRCLKTGLLLLLCVYRERGVEKEVMTVMSGHENASLSDFECLDTAHKQVRRFKYKSYIQMDFITPRPPSRYHVMD